jgi:hypothetical protein
MLSSCCTHGGGLPTRNVCPLCIYSAATLSGRAACWWWSARMDRERVLAVLGDRPASAPRSADRIQLDLSVLMSLQFDHCLFTASPAERSKQMLSRLRPRGLNMRLW